MIKIDDLNAKGKEQKELVSFLEARQREMSDQELRQIFDQVKEQTKQKEIEKQSSLKI